MSKPSEVPKSPRVPEEVLTEAEERFERVRKKAGLFLGPAVALALYRWPMDSITPEAHTLAAILGWISIWWVTEAIPIPAAAVLGPVLCVLFRLANAGKVFAPFADPLIYLFFGSFILANAMALHGLDRRFAFAILSLKGVGGSTTRILFAFGAISAFISMWISNTATTAMMLPIGLGIVAAVAKIQSMQTGKETTPSRLAYSTGVMLMTAYAASAGGIGTPVGTPPNIIGIAMIERYVHYKISFFQWMSFAVPLLVVMYVALYWILRLLHPPEIVHLKGSREYIRAEQSSLGPWTRGEKNSLIAFGVTVALWILPGVLAAVWGAESTLYKAFNATVPESVAAIVGALLLFMLPVDWKAGRMTMTWKEATRIDWGALLLFGGGISMGNMMFDTGLAEAIGRGVLGLTGLSSTWGITFGSVFIAILVSEATSNTASANMVVPVMISLSLAAGANPIPPAIGGTLGASWGFMLPVSTAPNAIVYGSGLVPITKMIRAGVWFDIVGGLLIWLGLRLLLPLVGLG